MDVRGDGHLARGRRAAVSLGLLVLVWSALAVARAPRSRAAGTTFTVDSTADLVDAAPGDGVCLAAGGGCTLRAAVMEANAGGTAADVVVPHGTYTLSIAPAGGAPDASGDLNLTDPGGVTILGDLADPASTVIDAAGIDRVFSVGPSVAATIAGVTITGGASTAGGGIDTSGTLDLHDSRLVANRATASGGALFSKTGGSTAVANVVFDANRASNGGAIEHSDGPMTITGSTFTGNVADAVVGPPTGLGGAIEHVPVKAGSDLVIASSVFDGNRSVNSGGAIAAFNFPIKITGSRIVDNVTGFAGGGIEADSGTDVTIDTTTIAGNHASTGAGIDVFAHNQFKVTRTTISGNVADGASGFFPGEGGGVFVEQGQAVGNPPDQWIDVTIADNLATVTGGGIRITNGSDEQLALTQATLSRNTAGGGASQVENDDAGSLVTFEDAIVDGTCASVPGGLSSLGHNVELGAGCGFTAAGDRQDTDPQLGPLADNGGPTRTKGISRTSPAMDAGTCPAGGLAADQRGVARPQDGDGAVHGPTCDIGAFERAAGTSVGVAVAPAPSSIVGQPVTVTVTVTPAVALAGTPTGNVSIFDGLSLLAVVPLSSSGVATASAPLTAPGVHSISAVSGGDFNFHSQASASVPYTVVLPVAPSVTVARGPAAGQVQLAWTAPAPGSGVTAVRILRGPDVTHLAQVTDVAPGATSFTDSGLAPGSSVTYAVASVAAGSVGPAGPPSTVVVPGVVRAVADTVTAVGARPVTVDVLANDVGVDLAPARAVMLERPVRGTATVAGDGRHVTVDPDDSVFGPVTVLYRVDSAAVLPADVPVTGSLTVDVEPVAVQAAVGPDGGVVDVAAGDPDVAAVKPGVSLQLIGGPAHGTATVGSATTISYVPEPGFVGTDTVTYRAVAGAPKVGTARAAAVPGHVSTGRITIAVTAASAETFSRPSGSAEPVVGPGRPSAPTPAATQPSASTASGAQAVASTTSTTSTAGTAGTAGPAGTQPAGSAGPVAGETAAAARPPEHADNPPATAAQGEGIASGPPGGALRIQAAVPAGLACSRVSVFFGDDRLATAAVHDGRFRLSASVPGDASTGLHELSYSCHGDRAGARRPLPPFRVTRASAHRSAFVTSVHLPRAIPLDAKNLAESAALAAVLLALVAFPAELFNSTLDENYDEVRRWFGFTGPLRGRVGGGWTTALVFFGLSGAVYSLLDPGFGLDLSSLAEYAGLVASLVLVTAAFSLPSLIAVHRRTGQWGKLRVLPGTVLLAGACVALSRLLHFQPGYLYGLIAGFTFATSLGEDEEGALSALASVTVLVVSVLAWLAWLPVQDRTAQAHPPFLLLVLEAALAATFVSGLESVVVGLLPLRFLDGARIMRWRRPVWAAVFALGLFGFVHVLLRPGAGYVGHSSAASAVAVLAVFAGFSLASVGFWSYFRFRKVRPEERVV